MANGVSVIDLPNSKDNQTPHNLAQSFFRFRRSAIVEMAIFFAIAFGVDYGLMDGHRFYTVSPHPYWFIVLLISMSYGAAEGLLAVVLSSAALLVGNLPPQPIDQDSYAYIFDVARVPLAWLLAAALFGAVRARQIKERETLREELGKAKDQAKLMFDSYGKLKSAKAQLEVQITSQRQTVDRIYQAVLSVDRLNSADVVEGVADLVPAVITTDKFSLFLLHGDSLQAALTVGWGEEEPLAHEFNGHSRLFEEIVANRRILLASLPEDREILGIEGLAAGPLVGPQTGEIFGMLKLDAMPFIEFNPITIAHFRLLCEWIALAYERAKRFEQISLAGVGADRPALVEQLPSVADYLAMLGERAGFEMSSASISIDGLPVIAPADQERRKGEIARTLRGELRGIDLVFPQPGEVNQFYVLLPLIGKAEAERVVARTVTALDARWGGDESYVTIAAGVQVLQPSKGTTNVTSTPVVFR